MLVLILFTSWACSYSPGATGPADEPTPDTMPAMQSQIEWLGEVELVRDGWAIPADKLLVGPVTVCAQTYPMGAVATAMVRWRSGGSSVREVAMEVAREGVGPFGHNTQWCAAVDAAAGELAIEVIAEDAAGAAVSTDFAAVARTEIPLFDTATDAVLWRMAGHGGFVVASDTLEAAPAGGELGLYWAAIPTPPDFVVSAEVRLDQFDDNSGIHLRFRDPDAFGYDNPAWVAVHDGLEIQIDETARPDGADVHRTGAVYEQPSTFVRAPDGVPGQWRRFEIRVQGMRVTVHIDGAQVTDLVFPGDASRPDRARPSAPGAPRFVGLQAHTGRVGFRAIRLRAL
jgi:hypothetical protein